jgi:CheY-like chemotaxis protein
MPNPKNILLAEDEAAIRGLFRAVLAGTGFQVIEAADGSRALEIAIERASVDPPEPLDVLVTDIMMPGVDGLDIAHVKA